MDSNRCIQGPAEVLSDMYFLEVVSTEDEFYKARNRQGGGGEGHGGDDDAFEAEVHVDLQRRVILEVASEIPAHVRFWREARE